MAAVSSTPTPFQPGFRLVDGAALNTAFAIDIVSAGDGFTASTTQTRLGGLPLTRGVTCIDTANNNDAVTLCGPMANPLPQGSIQPQAGMQILVHNNSGNTIQVFPPGANDVIEGNAAGAAVNLSTNRIGFYQCISVVGGVSSWIGGYMLASA